VSLRTETVFRFLTFAVLLYQIVLAVGVALFDEAGDRWVFVFIFLLGVALIALGSRFSSRMPLLAGVATAVGVFPSILLFWMVIPPLIALAVAVHSILDGRTRQRMLRATT
jgi:hypothetical protein